MPAQIIIGLLSSFAAMVSAVCAAMLFSERRFIHNANLYKIRIEAYDSICKYLSGGIHCIFVELNDSNTELLEKIEYPLLLSDGFDEVANKSEFLFNDNAFKILKESIFMILIEARTRSLLIMDNNGIDPDISITEEIEERLYLAFQAWKNSVEPELRVTK